MRMFPFRRAKDETDEFTRIREAVRVEPTVAPADDPNASWVRPMTPSGVPGQPVQPMVAPVAPPVMLNPAVNPYDYAQGVAQPVQVPAAAASGTVVFQDATFDGRLNSEGNIHIQGKVSGEVRAADTVYVAREARVQASIRAANVVVAGEVVGDITCSGKLEVIPTGRISGEVDAGRLVIHEGAYVNSAFKMADGRGGRNGDQPGLSGRPGGA
jgi:cytoskeletal protein CcmA (bactofilin family)